CDGGGVEWWLWRWWGWRRRRVAESGYGDRVDPVTGTLFGVGRKSPSENFSGGGVVAVAGIRKAGEGCRNSWGGRE
ncbi:hypothetical protein Tco_1210031, partial [Tanacetum coccineum]